MTATARQWRLIAIPVLICASWLLDSRQLILTLQSLMSTNEKAEKIHVTGVLTDKNKTGALKESPLPPFDTKDDKKPWYEQSAAVLALKQATSMSLSEEEELRWYAEPSFPPPPKVECPSPKSFQQSWKVSTELEFTDRQKSDLRKQLEQGSTTIRDAFMPFIDNGGLHPDLILHAGNVVGLLIGIFDGKVTFSGSHSNAKVRLLAEHLESVMDAFHKQGVKIPNVIFPYTVRSIPPVMLTSQCARESVVPKHLQNRYDAAPVAGIAMDPNQHVGVALMPNMYFGNIQVWDRYTELLMEGRKMDTPWDKRRKRVFWRGKVDKKLWANVPRVEALQAAARDAQTPPRRMDITLTSGCNYLRSFAKNTTQTSPLAPKWLPKDYFLKVTKCGGNQRTPHAKFTNYWAQLNLPGSSLGSYSKNLQNLWPTGAAVMMWDQSAVEFYYDTLKTGVTHVWVNETRIEPLAEKLFANDGELAQLMGKVAREWFKEHLTGKALLEYYKQWFEAYAALQRFSPTPDMLRNACTCAGWIDSDKQRHNGMKRCSHCASYPNDINRGCQEMMGLKSDSSACK